LNNAKSELEKEINMCSLKIIQLISTQECSFIYLWKIFNSFLENRKISYPKNKNSWKIKGCRSDDDVSERNSKRHI